MPDGKVAPPKTPDRKVSPSVTPDGKVSPRVSQPEHLFKLHTWPFGQSWPFVQLAKISFLLIFRCRLPTPPSRQTILLYGKKCSLLLILVLQQCILYQNHQEISGPHQIQNGCRVSCDLSKHSNYPRSGPKRGLFRQPNHKHQNWICSWKIIN